MWPALGIILIFAALVIWGRIAGERIRAAKSDGSYANKFVFVEDDGTARELTEDQKDHLNTEYYGADGNRPYIKGRYGQRTPDGKIGGYLKRRKLPRQISVAE
jgi:hypothetical protein